MWLFSIYNFWSNRYSPRPLPALFSWLILSPISLMAFTCSSKKSCSNTWDSWKWSILRRCRCLDIQYLYSFWPKYLHEQWIKTTITKILCLMSIYILHLHIEFLSVKHCILSKSYCEINTVFTKEIKLVYDEDLLVWCIAINNALILFQPRKINDGTQLWAMKIIIRLNFDQ